MAVHVLFGLQLPCPPSLGYIQSYRYIWALYWSVTTMATVGYGDISAISIPEKVVAMFAMLIGASIFAYFMGAMSTLITALNAANARWVRWCGLGERAGVEHHVAVPGLVMSPALCTRVMPGLGFCFAGMASLPTRVHLFSPPLELHLMHWARCWEVQQQLRCGCTVAALLWLFDCAAM
jgi:hypothetical protein